jgi:hypothetical protein
MPIKLFDTQEAVPEAQRASAIKTADGKWAAEEIDTALGEKGEKALEAAKEKAKVEEKARKKAEEELAALKRTQEAKDKGISEEDLEKIRLAEAAARKPIEEERDRLAAENRKLKLTDQVKVLWLKHGGFGEREEDAMDQLAKRSDLGDAGGIVWKDKDGKVTTMTPEQFFAAHKAEKPWLYRGDGASGSGAESSAGAGGSDAAEKARATGKAMGEAQKKATTEASALALR